MNAESDTPDYNPWEAPQSDPNPDATDLQPSRRSLFLAGSFALLLAAITFFVTCVGDVALVMKQPDGGLLSFFSFATAPLAALAIFEITNRFASAQLRQRKRLRAQTRQLDVTVSRTLDSPVQLADDSEGPLAPILGEMVFGFLAFTVVAITSFCVLSIMLSETTDPHNFLAFIACLIIGLMAAAFVLQRFSKVRQQTAGAEHVESDD